MKTLNFEAIKPILAANDVEYAALFGSYARDEQKPDSDVDILVRFKEPKSFFELDDIEEQLSEKLEKRKVDIVTEKALSSYIKPYVLKDLRIIYERR
ncbi:MAG TPA: nucleotidyltransferase family protein [Candidatus Paceibacterota bacterium]